MKTPLLLLFGLCFLNYSAFAAAEVIEAGPHHRVWRNSAIIIDDQGQQITITNLYTELATGLNYFNAQTGQWEESQESFEIARTGEAIVSKGQIQVILAPNINSGGSVDVLAPDGKRFVSNPMGLGYYDSATGKNVLIAEVKDCLGQQIAPNVILYDDAFTDLKGAIRYTYTRLGISQDIILYQKPPSPADWGIDPASCTMDFYSEFHIAPVPEESVQLIAPNLADETLDFGQSRISQGSAYFLSQELDSIRVAKQWTTIEGRTFLIESVPYESALPLLEKLQAAVKKEGKSELAKKVLPNRRELLARVETKKPQKNPQLAAIQPGRFDLRSAFVLDYTTFNTSQTNLTFDSDKTYYFSGSVSLYGTNTTFEGGAVLKYTNDVTLKVNTPVSFKTGPYRPVILTARDDNCVGEIILPVAFINYPAYYAKTALFIDANAAGTNVNIHDIRIRYAQTCLAINTRPGHVITHAQFVYSQNGIAATNAEMSVRNALFYFVDTNFTGLASTGRCEHLTLSRATWMNKDIGTNLFLTNSLLYLVENTGSYFAQSTSNNIYASPYPFKLVEQGTHYLKDDTFRNIGTTNINSDLKNELRQKTTYAPVYLVTVLTTNS